MTVLQSCAKQTLPTFDEGRVQRHAQGVIVQLSSCRHLQLNLVDTSHFN